MGTARTGSRRRQPTTSGSRTSTTSSLSQAAFLAGLPQLPSVYDPYYNDQGPERAIARRDQVLRAMLRDGYITQAQMDDA